MEVADVARYMRGLEPTRSASPRRAKVSHALPTAPPEWPSILASSVTVNIAAGSAASSCATMARNWPGRAFPPGPGSEIAGTAGVFGVLEVGACGVVPDGGGVGAAVAVIS
ncbi:hypothetical protein [Streptomyces sp. NPDC002573]|uniref:hypothetical protein n=1 Tax=Streptomyces sp. NPDC002573 TaxID=3364651 RepID=UPI0036B04700